MSKVDELTWQIISSGEAADSRFRWAQINEMQQGNWASDADNFQAGKFNALSVPTDPNENV